jgi:hypothetical protein
VKRRTRIILVVTAALVLPMVAAMPALAAVTVTRADLSGTSLRVEGTATANRDITVDGAVMGRSDSGGKFRISASGYTAPADCTIDVNDATGPRTATLSGCTVRTPPPPPPGGPAAPVATGPADGASMTSPLTLSWSAVLDPGSQNGGYNWQIGTSPTFSQLVTRDSTTPAVTSATVGGLVAGTYYWQVQAVTGGLELSAYSAPRSFVVTGPGAGTLAAPVLAALAFGTTYHPMESFPFSWNAVPGAASYVVEASRDPGFPAPVELTFDNVPNPNYGLTMHGTLVGDWSLRVRAVDANRVQGPVSNVRTFTISYSAPVGPAPTLVSPPAGAVLELPILLDWNDVPNPQDLGYEVQVSRDSSFATLEVQGPLTSSQYTLLGLSAGQKFWRVRASQGDSSATTAAMTAFSEVRSFTVSTAPPKVTSVTFGRPSAFSGEFLLGELQLSGPAPAGGAVVSLTSTSPQATPVTSVTIDAGQAFTYFPLTTGQVTTSTGSTVTAAYGGAAATTTLTVDPPSLKGIGPSPNSITGGAVGGATLAFNGAAPAAGAVVSLTSSSPLAAVPATVTASAGSFFHPFSIQTSQVDVTTTVSVVATWQGTQVTHLLTLTPAVPPTEWTIDRTQTTGSQGASARVAIAAAQSTDQSFTLTSSDPAVAWTSQKTVTISAGTLQAGVLVLSSAPSASTTVTLTVSGGGVSRTVSLVVNPYPPAPLPAPSLLSPAAAARFAPTQSIPFDWSDVAGAVSYTLQVSSTSTFASTVLDRTVTPSQLTATLPTTGDRFWRVRANRSTSSGGAWSAVRTLRVK